MYLPRSMTRASEQTARPDLVKLRFGQYLILPTVHVLFLWKEELKRGGLPCIRKLRSALAEP